MADDIEKIFEKISLEDLTVKHRKEKKELQAKIQALKKNASKSKRKEVMEEVTRLEQVMEERHANEIESANKAKDANIISVNVNDNNNVAHEYADNTDNNVITNNQNTADNNQPENTQRVSKAQKRRDKKAREAHRREEKRRVATEDAQYAPKAQEAAQLQAILDERQLQLYEVPSDGNCLYNAVRHQLLQSGLAKHSVEQLREEIANYILANKSALSCYMVNPKTGDSLTDEEFLNYCENIRSTPAWGGQIELKALTAVLHVPIEVLQADGPPTVQGVEFPGPNLIITYHRHMYTLGEHYNSTQPLRVE